MADLYDPDYGPRQATYDLRRLRLKGLIERIPGTYTYLVTGPSRRTAAKRRALTPTLSRLLPPPAPESGLCYKASTATQPLPYSHIHAGRA